MNENNYILEIENLSVNVKGTQLLKDLNLKVPYGEVHALFGQNGSGKTSLMMTIMGFSNYEITQGRILYKGRDITGLDVNERAKLGIAISQQRPPTIEGVSLHTMLSYILKDEPDSEGKINKLAETTNMKPFLERSINDGLSGGEIKRAEFLQLLAMQPEFSMLDEPDSGVDIEALNLVGGLINKLFSPDGAHPVKRRSGLIITHSGNISKYIKMDKAHVMHEGRIGCSGNPELVMDTIGVCGYEECVRCIEEGRLQR